MNLLPPSQSWRRTHRINGVSQVFLPKDLIADVLSLLPAKTLTRFRCVSPSWNSLITDHAFVKLHLDRSSQKEELTLVHIPDWLVVSFTVFRLLENPPIIINLPEDPYYHLIDMDTTCIVGSCNGLICLFGHSFTNKGCEEMWFRCWNPATRTISLKLRYSRNQCLPFTMSQYLAFGYDNSSDTYKVVYLVPEETTARVFRMGENVWIDIQDSSVVHDYNMTLVALSRNVNWLAICNYFTPHYDCKDITIDQFVIISLDFGTETHTQLHPPHGFKEVPFVVPCLSVLKDCLCFSYDLRQTHFVIWQMKEFGVAESWTQFLKINYHSLQIYDHFNDSGFQLLPVHLSEKNNTLLLANIFESRSILYNWRYNTLERIEGFWWLYGKKYVESLVMYP